MVAVMLGVMFLIYPVCADDHWYMGGVDGAPWSMRALSSAWEQVVALWHVSTGRAGNLASALFLGFLPRPVWAADMAGCCFGTLVAGPRVIGCRPLSATGTLWTAGSCFAFPWLDYMFSILYSMNYFPALLLGLVTFAFYERSYDASGSKSMVAAAATAFLAAWWHEGLAVPLAVALVVYSLVRGGRVPRRAAVILAALALGMACIGLSPAFWDSMDFREPIWNRGSASWRLLHLMGFNCFFYIYLIAMTVALAVRKCRGRLLASRPVAARLLALLAIGLVTLPIYIKYYAGPRTGIFSQMFCLAGLLSLGAFLCPRGIKRRGRAVLATVVYALCVINIAAAIGVQRHLSAEAAAVDKLWSTEQARERGAVFFDVTPPRAGFDLFKASHQLLNTSYGLEGRTVLPARLESFDSSRDGRTCTADTMLLVHEGLLIYRGPWDMGTRRTHRPDVVLTTAGGDTLESRADWYSFRDAAGRECTYVVPHACILNPATVIADARRKKIP
ncbi:MAG: hypothetical protein K2F72_05085 [Muribaculaceae bacterium]|nr:hypothetical protein [Muribaculaceae bacterium]